MENNYSKVHRWRWMSMAKLVAFCRTALSISILLFFIQQNALAQCPAPNPFQTEHLGSVGVGVTPATLNTPVYAHGTWAGHFVRVHVVDGNRYKFSLVGSEARLAEQFGHVNNGFPAGAPSPNISFLRPQVDHDPIMTVYDNTGSTAGFQLSGNVVAFNEDASATEILPELEYTATYTGELYVAVDLQPGTPGYNTGTGPPNTIIPSAPVECNQLFQDSTSMEITWIPSGPALFSAIKDSDTQITVSFTQNILTNGGNPTDFEVTDGIGTSFPVSAQADGTAGDANIVLTVADFSSAIGDVTVSYTNNNNEIVDTTDPTVFGVNSSAVIDLDTSPPTLQSAVVVSTTEIKLTFSEPIQTKDVNHTDFSVVDQASTAYTVTGQTDGIAKDNEITLTVDDFTGSTQLTITYTDNNGEISDFGSNDLATDATGLTIPVFTLSDVTGPFYWEYQGGGPSLPAGPNPAGLDVAVLPITPQRQGSVAFGDLDGDGDVDFISGGNRGSLYYFQNTGTPTSPHWEYKTGVINSLDTIKIGQLQNTNEVQPTLHDFDSDGDLDLIVGSRWNYIGLNKWEDVYVFINGGSPTNPVFDPVILDNRYGIGEPNGVERYFFRELPVPAFVDIDGDNDSDLLIAGSDSITYLKNVGTATAPMYEWQEDDNNPLRPVSRGGTVNEPDFLYPGLQFADFDNDGDFDMYFTSEDGFVEVFENTGTATTPVFTNSMKLGEPFGSTDHGAFGKLSFADVNNDGIIDIMTTHWNPSEWFWYAGRTTVLNPILTSVTKNSDTQITATFDQNVQTNGGNPTDFTVVDGQGTNYVVSAQADGTAGDADIVLTVANLSAAVGDLTVTYTNNNDEISDAASGQKIAANGSKSIDVDTSAPTLVSATVDSPTQLTLTLSELVQTNGGNPTDFTVVDGNNASYAVSAQADGTAQDNQIVLTVADFSLGQGSLTITYTNNNNEIKDFGGNNMASDATGVQVPIPFIFTSTPVTEIFEGNTYSYIVTTNATGGSITATTVPGWLSIQPSGGLSTAAGNGTGSVVDNTDPLQASFQSIGGIAVDAAGNIFIVEKLFGKIRRIDGATGAVTTFAGDGNFASTDNADPLQAQFLNPDQIAIDGSGNIYVSEGEGNSATSGHRIRRIDGQTGAVTTVAGSDKGYSDNATGTLAQFDNPSVMAIDAAGNVFVADKRNNRIRRIDVNTGAVTTVAGSATRGLVDNADPLQAQFDSPEGLAIDAAGNIFVADEQNHVIRRIDGNTGEVTTVAGTGTSGYTDNADPLQAQFDKPSYLDIDPNGNLFIGDKNNRRVRRMDGTSGEVTTVAGDGSSAIVNNTDPLQGSFTAINGIALDAAGNLYVSDFRVIRKLTPPGVQLTGDTNGQVGDHPVVLSATDGGSGMAEQSFTVTVEAFPTLVSGVRDSDTQITLKFSEAVQTNGTNPTDFTVVDANSMPYVVSAQADGTANDNMIVLTVADFSTAAGPLTVTYTNNNDEITDFGNNALATDATGIEIPFFPVMESATLDSDTQITVTFDQNVQTNGGNPTDFTVTDASGNTYAVSAQADGTAGDANIVLTVADMSQVNGALTVTYTNNNNEISDANTGAQFVETDATGVKIERPFITVWELSGNTTLGIDLYDDQTYDFTIDWGDGTIETNQTSVPFHTYASVGTYTVEISGLFPGIYVNQFANNQNLSRSVDFLKEVKQWGSIEWKRMDQAFKFVPNVNVTATDAPDLRQVTSLKEMFDGSTSFNGAVGHWDVSTITTFERTFGEATAFNQPLNDWDVSNATNLDGIFNGATMFNQPLDKWDVSSVTNFEGVFRRTEAFNQPLASWDLSAATTIDAMFEDTKAFNQPLNAWDVSKVTDFEEVFEGSEAFNQDLDQWDVSSGTSMEEMFEDALVFNANISTWNVSNVTDMSSMFEGAGAFNSDIGNWDVSSVTDMDDIFRESPFNQDIGSWDVSNTPRMSNMFNQNKVFNQDISGWNTAAATTLSNTFNEAEAFNQDLSNWNVTLLEDAQNAFNSSNLSIDNYDKLLEAWSQQSVKMNVEFGANGVKYSSEGAVFRQKLIDDFSWSFNGDILATSLVAGSQFEVGKIQLEFNNAISIQSLNTTDFSVKDGAGNMITVTSIQDDVVSDQFLTLLADLTGASGSLEIVYTNNNDAITDAATGTEIARNATINIDRAFVTTWNVTDEGSGAKLVFPLGTDANTDYDFTIDWGDGTTEGYSGKLNSLFVASNETAFTKANNADESLEANQDRITNDVWITRGTNQGLFNYNETTSFTNSATTIEWAFGTTATRQASDYTNDFKAALNNSAGNIILTGTVSLHLISEDRYFDLVFTQWTSGGNGGGFSYTRTEVAPAIEVSHTYASAAEYTIAVGDNLPAFSLNAGTEKDKLKSIDQWGNIAWKNVDNAFKGASNMTYQATDLPDLSGLTSLAGIFQDATSFNGAISNWDVSTIATWNNAFSGASSFNQNLAAWDVTGATDMTGLLDNTAMTFTNYDNTLIGWEAQMVNDNVPLGATGVNYCLSKMQRQALIDDHSWSITDGGEDCPPFVTSVAAVDGTYKIGDALVITVTFDNAVTVTGTPQLPLVIGSTSVNATYVAGTSTATELKFSYTVLAGQEDTDGIALGTEIDLNGATMQDAFSRDADLTLNNIASTVAVLVDGIVPFAGAVLEIYDDSNVASDLVTNDNTLTFGSAPFDGDQPADIDNQAAFKDDTHEVFLNDQSIGQATPFIEGGNVLGWLLDHSGTTLDDGSYAVKVVTTDAAGNITNPSDELIRTLIVDTSAPDAPTVDLVASSDTGVSDSDNLTTDTTPTLEGTAEANSTIEVFVDASSVGTTTADDSGNWTLTPATALADGSFEITVKATDLAGNTSDASDALSITIDNTLVISTNSPADDEIDVLPNANLTITFDKNVVKGTGNIQIIQSSNDEVQQTIDVTGDNVTVDGATVTIDPPANILPPDTEFYINIDAGAFENEAGAAYAGLSSKTDWSFTIIAASVVSSVTVPGDGDYKIGDELTFTVDMVLPVSISGGTATIPVTIGDQTVNATQVGTVTNSSSFSFSYTIVEGDLDRDGISVGSAMNLNGGTMKDEFDVDAVLTLNSVGATTAVLVDGVIPAAPVISSISDDTGTAGDDGITNEQSLFVRGTAEANSRLSLLVDGQPIFGGVTIIVDDNGDWEFSPIGEGEFTLDEGDHVYTASVEDAAGNESPVSDPYNITIDLTAPAAPTVDLVASSDLGTSNSDDLTSDITPEVSGTAEANTIVEVFVDDSSVGTTNADGAGNWTFTITTNWGDGTYAITANAKDAAGNTGDKSSALSITLDGSLAISSTSPVDNEVDVLPSTNLTATFDKNVVKGTGNITIKQSSDDTVIETIDVTGSNVTINGAVVTIDPVDFILPPDTEFYINIDAGAFENEAGAPFAGISDKTTWSFTIIAASVVTSVAVPADGTYMIGDNLDFTVNMVLPISITGTASIPVTIGSSTVNAMQVGTVSNINSILFRYTVVEDELDADGIVLGTSMDLNGGTMQDEFGVDAILALNSVASTAAVLVDGVKPIPTISSSAVDLVNGTFSATIAYDETVENVAASDLTVVNGTAGNLQPVTAGSVWTVDITPTADGEVSLSLAANTANDLAGNDNKASNSISRDFDGTPPEVVSVNRSDADPVNTGITEVNFQIVFSEAVTGVDMSDLELILTGSATGTLNTLTAVDATTYNVNVNGIGGQGTIGLNVKDDDSIIDAAINPLAAAFTGQVYTTNFIPTDISLSAIDFDENNGLTDVLAAITTTDADAGDTHTYTLVAGEGSEDNGFFMVDGTDLKTNNLSLNFEFKSDFRIRLQTDDGKGGIYQEFFALSVLDVNEAPFQISLSNNTIDESDNAQDVGMFMTLDPDAGDSYTYTLVEGDNDAHNDQFAISGNTLRTAGAINFEEGASRDIRVRATDSGGLFFEWTFTITIEEVTIEPIRDYETNVPGGAVRNIFSPNGDGVNETWVIEDLLDNPVNEVKVYAQGGKLIFSQVNYQNDWGGTFKGNPIPPGTYYYEINVYNGERIIKGFLTIIRN